MLKIVLIGAGNVGTHLGKAISNLRSHTIIQVYSRTRTHAKTLGLKLQCPYTHTWSEINKKADLYLLAIKDDDIYTCAKLLREYISPQALVVHTSGSVSMNGFVPFFKNHGVFYPLQTFSAVKKNIGMNIPFLISASNKKSEMHLSELAYKMSPTVYVISDDTRAYLHLAAVMVNNFTNHLYQIANRLLEEKKIHFEILRPLIEETTNKLKTLSPYDAQTGPARRLDQRVLKLHRKMLKAKHPDWSKIYSLMTQSIIKTYHA